MAKSTYTTFASQTFNDKLDRDHKRATDARRKYAYGTTTGGPGSSRTKPARAWQGDWYRYGGSYLVSPGERAYMHKLQAQGRTQEVLDLNQATRHGNHVDYVDAAYPTVDQLDIEHCAQERMQDDFIYSYDHPTGPSTGSQVLGAAIDRAVERFENQVTESLVKDEYSVVDEHEQAEDSKEPEHDDDFELV